MAGRSKDRRLARLGLVALVASASTLALPAPAQAADEDLVVMTRNLYLGADVSSALKLLPDLPAAAQDMCGRRWRRRTSPLARRCWQPRQSVRDPR
jgi:hypothetical protein